MALYDNSSESGFAGSGAAWQALGRFPVFFV